MEREPLSVREGRREAQGPYGGVPVHLRSALVYWLQGAFGYRRTPARGGMSRSAMLEVGVAARIPVELSTDPSAVMASILKHCLADDEVFLDVVDATLGILGRNSDTGWLEDTLRSGNSAWKVAADRSSLQRRVDPTAQLAIEQAISPSDSASAELSEAWAKAYGRHPDPSDAWDHAIKAVEAILIPLVCPSQRNPQFGHVRGELRKPDTKWQLLLSDADGSHSVEPLLAMLDRLWPNPDRHVDGKQRTPTLEEAQAVVHLAVTVVQWGRSGVITKP